MLSATSFYMFMCYLDRVMQLIGLFTRDVLSIAIPFISETSVLIRATWRHIPEDGILHSHRRENFKSYKIFICPVRYELGFYTPEDAILHSHCHENLKSYIAFTGPAL
jgi:hypothetical protein